MGVYANNVIARNPIGYWKFNETSGSTFLDYSGNGRHGTYPASGVTLGYATGICNEGDLAARFTGGFGSVPYHPDWRMNGSHTFSGWFRQTQTAPGGYPGLITFGSVGAFTDGGGWLWFTSDDPIVWRHHWKRTGEPQPGTPFTDATGFLNCLVYYVATYNAGTGIVSLYLNGDLVNSTDVGAITQISTTEAPLTVALNNEAATNDNHLFRGMVCHIALYNRALTANEVLTDYRQGSCPDCPDKGPPPPVGWMVGAA